MSSFRRRIFLSVLFSGSLSLGGWLVMRFAAPAEPAEPESPPADRAAAVPARSSPESERSQLANDLLSPEGSPLDDIRIVQDILAAWRTNFPGKGNPVGDNREITSALTGRNSLGFAFVPAGHRALSPDGELRDRWGTPFRFHALSGTQMEIWSAGPDRRFSTADDVRSE